MSIYSFDFSDGKPWTDNVMDLEYGSCATCGKMVPLGLDRCFDCEFYKPHAEKERIRIVSMIREAIDILEKANNGGNE